MISLKKRKKNPQKLKRIFTKRKELKEKKRESCNNTINYCVYVSFWKTRDMDPAAYRLLPIGVCFLEGAMEVFSHWWPNIIWTEDHEKHFCQSNEVTNSFGHNRAIRWYSLWCCKNPHWTKILLVAWKKVKVMVASTVKYFIHTIRYINKNNERMWSFICGVLSTCYLLI